MKSTIVLLEGDGIGPEVVGAARQALTAIADVFGHAFRFSSQLIGGAALRAGLQPLPAATRGACVAADAVLLGAVGDPQFDAESPERRPERGLLELRQALAVFANLRPARVWSGAERSSPLRPEVLAGTDFLVVRELTGGLYYGEPRGFDKGRTSAVNTLRYSREEVTRIAHVAFTEARARRRDVTSVDKANVLEVSQLWREAVTGVARAYPDVALRHLYVDNCAMQIALNPKQFDVILTENLFGDVLSDEAGAVVGSLGLLPSASVGEGPGLFEPVHGSAPALVGKDVANPGGAIASAAMLLRYGLKLAHEAERLEAAIAGALADGWLTADVAPPGARAVKSSELTGEIIRRLRSSPGSGADPRRTRDESRCDTPGAAAGSSSRRA